MKAAKAPEISNFRSETATVNGTRLHYWIGGNLHGKPVLLWHGFLGTAYSWHKVMPLLADAGYAVLVPDMRGYGDSDKPAGIAGYDARSLAEEFRAMVKQLEFGRWWRRLPITSRTRPSPHAATLSRKRNRTSSSNCFGTSRQRSPEHDRPLPDFRQ
jgi:alpha-beta hydrolase superfamily lysophospholipase